ncbi:MAG TPA: hypothetical protein VGO76_14405 [Luteibacter sp.]|nr:hypothetical protein [Luteibacter sp.]
MATKKSDQGKQPPAPKETGRDTPKRPEDTTSSGDARNGAGEDNHASPDKR